MEIERKTLVLFDFDGTLTRHDSLPRFLLFAAGWSGLCVGVFKTLLRWSGLFLSGHWSRHRAKEALYAAFFKGQSRATLEQLGQDFCEKKVPGLLRPDVFEKMQAYQKAGCTLALVSASPDVVLRFFARQNGMTLLCTEFEFENERFTGRFATPNCKYEEKTRRVRAAFDVSNFEKTIAYGNSSGDAAMLDMADERHWVV